MCGFPSREGIKGCVMVRCAVWVEVFFLGGVCLLWVDAFDLGGYARTSHTPGPSREGRFGYLFLVGNEWFVVWFPLLRGD